MYVVLQVVVRPPSSPGSFVDEVYLPTFPSLESVLGSAVHRCASHNTADSDSNNIGVHTRGGVSGVFLFGSVFCHVSANACPNPTPFQSPRLRLSILTNVNMMFQVDEAMFDMEGHVFYTRMKCTCIVDETIAKWRQWWR